ncbi:GIY-YIG nuclease family protein [Candidatus Dojkabacteria bacterium]|uniref:GIY-YIG nuclease family protein n=1 Tax=Candidatus Dojkabacteria bacterium TaxID=2099670 RepID=A0A955L9B7_9BACT|nr:GIY-YIG nuclease family protein [Candidatus Dojkabacteria bacterium]
MYYVYILYSESLNKTYTGETSNLRKRLVGHKSGNTQTTRNSSDYKLVWYASSIDQLKAKKFERYLKTSSGRAFIKKRLLGKLVGSS